MESYSFTLEVGEDGKLEITELDGHIPPGRFEIDGYTGGNSEFVRVDRRDQQGRFAVSAQHHHNKKKHGPTPADMTITPLETGPQAPADGVPKNPPV